MSYDEKTLRHLFDKTDGCCHLCGKQMAWINYGKPGRQGAWEVDHSKPRAKGGSDHGNNLYAAHIRCSREKQTASTRSVRSQNGLSRAPASKRALQKRERFRSSVLATLGVMTVGALLRGFGR